MEGEVQERDVLEKRQARSASVRLAANQGSYYTSITLGTPPQTHEVLMDTGSADLVVLSTLTSIPLPSGGTADACSTNCIITAPLYDPSNSSSAEVTSQPVSITYGTGSAEGVLVSDSMGFGGWEANQTFIASPPSLASALVSSPDQTGLLGLAWQGLSESGAMPFVQSLFEAGSLEEPVMGFGLAPLDARSVPDPSAVVPGGILSLGTTLPSLYTGSLDYVPLSSTSGNELYWSIPLVEVQVAGKALGLSASAVVIDTGTNSIAIPQSAAEAIYSQIPGSAPVAGSQGIWSYPCSTDVSLTFIFGSTAYTLPPQSFNAGLVSSNGRLCAGAVSSLGSSRRGGETWIIGTPFLFSFYSAFRFSPPSVGFAPLNDSESLLAYGAIPTSSGGEVTVSVSGLGGAQATAMPGASAAGMNEVEWSTLMMAGVLALVLVGGGAAW
ncbi:aspartic peptidase domain-containing protein [Leucosporidium creatinivorum]|uniref:Aspartic peptidase domain-containing protein n=1 Tax=Leucosporidium creatinivorum TaxID=106004 RepID=A0A1Y2EYC7_9BASI|nr:aspartic peptidase domain-containing protein [Leucosporidium creatinivorum]